MSIPITQAMVKSINQFFEQAVLEQKDVGSNFKLEKIGSGEIKLARIEDFRDTNSEGSIFCNFWREKMFQGSGRILHLNVLMDENIKRGSMSCNEYRRASHIPVLIYSVEALKVKILIAALFGFQEAQLAYNESNLAQVQSLRYMMLGLGT